MNIIYGAYTKFEGPYTELGGAFGQIQAISDFIYLISAVISSDFRANRTSFHLCRTPRVGLGYILVHVRAFCGSCSVTYNTCM